MAIERKSTFFKQSGWLVIATGLSGAFLMAVYPMVNSMPTVEIGIFGGLLRLFTVLGVVSAGIQAVMAQQTASAVTDDLRRGLAAAVRNIALGISGVWLVIAFVCAAFQVEIVESLKLTNAAAVWVTLLLVLAQLLLPFVQGILQGAQNFAWLGWSIMLNGLGRFVGMLCLLWYFRGHATSALSAALIGLGAAVLAGYWPSRKLFAASTGRFAWGEWLRRVVPLTGAFGSSLFLMNADVIFVQSSPLSAEVTPFYSAVAMVGVGLVTFTAPMAAVMFPKMVRSVARAEASNSLKLALTGTVLLGIFAAITCTLFPSLPLRIMAFNSPHLWVSSQLIPWFMWCMLPITIANVLIANLMARQHFAVAPWLVLIAIGYGFTLKTYLATWTGTDHFNAFRGVIIRMGFFNLLLLAAAAIFTARMNHMENIQSTEAPGHSS